MTQVIHGPARIFCDQLGDGFVIACLCGEQTAAEETCADAGVAFDEHLIEMGVHPYWQKEADHA